MNKKPIIEFFQQAYFYIISKTIHIFALENQATASTYYAA